MRLQYHLCATGDDYDDVELVVILDAPSDHEGMTRLGELLPDLEYDVQEITCDGCLNEPDECACEEESNDVLWLPFLSRH